ncbi:MAG: hypothetical protein FWH53_00560 [Leptospirales bacterium]|nr:hypothetical protein [Leptospirales bacterium]
MKDKLGREIVGQKFDQKSVTQKLGYIPLTRRMDEINEAGIRLLMRRAEQYDFPDGKIDESFYDPLRKLNVDLADITQLDLRIKARMKEKADMLAQQKEAEKTKDVVTDDNPADSAAAS